MHNIYRDVQRNCAAYDHAHKFDRFVRIRTVRTSIPPANKIEDRSSLCVFIDKSPMRKKISKKLG